LGIIFYVNGSIGFIKKLMSKTQGWLCYSFR